MTDDLELRTFPVPLDGATALLDPLERIVADTSADIIVLAEMNHFVHEKTDFRLWLLRALAKRGVAVIAEELGWSDGARIDEFLQGSHRALKRIATLGYTGDRRTDRDHRPTGLLRESFEHYPIELFRTEQERFYRGLATLQFPNLRYFGFDVEADPGSAYADIEQALAPISAEVPVRQALSKLQYVPGESFDQELSRLDAVLRTIARQSDELPVGLADALVGRLETLRESIAYCAIAHPAPDYASLGPAMAVRENLMKRHLARIHATMQPGQRLVLLGHALHLAKDDAAITAAGGVGPGGGITTSLGHDLHTRLGARIFVVWLMYGKGEDSQPFRSLPRKHTYGPHTLNARLDAECRRRGGCGLVVRTASPLLRTPWDIGHMYGATFRARPSDQADAIVFLPVVTPLRDIDAIQRGRSP